MKRTMVYLPDDLHKNVKRLAVERETTITTLLKEALETLVEEDVQDLNFASNFLKTYKPGSGISWEQYKKNRPGSVKS